MFIILEGENKTGKSSLAKRLNKMTGWEIVKFSQPKKEPYIEYMEFLLTRKEPAIIDRFYLGEEVYGPLYREASGLNEWQLRMIEMTLMARMSLNIYCETDEGTITQKFISEGEEYATVKKIHSVLSYFRKAINKSELVWDEFNYRKDPDYLVITEKIIKWLNHWKQNENYLKKLIETRAIGNPLAKNVIVGDICNGDLELEKYKNLIIPFAKGVSSDYLWKCINGIDKKSYLLTNARKYHNNGKIDMSDIIDSRASKIICLGNNAYNIVDDSIQGMLPFDKLSKVKHPAYGVRFNIPILEYSDSIRKELV